MGKNGLTCFRGDHAFWQKANAEMLFRNSRFYGYSGYYFMSLILRVNYFLCSGCNFFIVRSVTLVILTSIGFNHMRMIILCRNLCFQNTSLDNCFRGSSMIRWIKPSTFILLIFKHRAINKNNSFQ